MAEYHKKYYRTDELARQMDVCPETVRRWIREGKVVAVKYGRTSSRIPHSEFVYIVENGPRKAKKSS